jgi:hypothetical protein
LIQVVNEGSKTEFAVNGIILEGLFHDPPPFGVGGKILVKKGTPTRAVPFPE